MSFLISIQHRASFLYPVFFHFEFDYEIDISGIGCVVVECGGVGCVVVEGGGGGGCEIKDKT